MPAGDGLGDDASRGSPTSAADQYSSSASVMVSQRPPPVFSAQQTPHRVQSSTNLDLVDCVGSDLLLAMNNLDVSEQQARACANLANNGCHHGLLEGGPGAGSPPPQHPPPSGDGGFLPLAALAPPPARQPSWLTAQQQQARAQNEHFPSTSRGSLYGCDSGEEGGGADGGGTHHRQLRSSSCGGVVMGGGRLDDDDSSRQQQAYPSGSSGNSNSRGSPGALPPPGFGLDSCSSVGSWNGSTNSSTNNPAAAAAAAAARLRRTCSSSSNGGNPHLDESWTAVLNAPAGAELMEFLTERPSRALVLWNVEAIGEDELRAACERHGPLYYLRAEHRRKRVIFVAYYDVRDAVNAHRSLGSELSKYLLDEHGARPRPAVHFSIELHAGFSYKEGSVVAHDLPSQVTEAEVGSVFQVYGDVRRVAHHHAYPSSFSVEFCSIQDARVAAQELTVRNPWGHGITVEPAVRSEAERALGKKLHATLNLWTAESTQVREDRMRSSSSSVVMSGRSSESDSPPPKPERDYGRGMGFMMDLHTPVTSMNTTPNTTPGSTPPSGADAHQNGGSKSPGVHHYMTMPPRQQHAHGRGTGGSSSAPPHPMYTSSSNGSNKNSMQQQQQQQFGGSNGGSGGHHHLHHLHRNGHCAHMDIGKPHPLASPLGGPAPYGPPSSSSSPGCNGYYVDVSPGYHGDHDDTRTPPAPMWAAAASVSPPPGHVGSGGMRGSPPLRGMPGGCAGAGGLGYKDVRTRQMSLDEARLQHGNSGGGGGARTVRCNSDSSSQILMAASSPHSAGPECSGNGGHEFSLDLKKVSKGMDKRTTIMVRNIPNKYTQTMLLQEIDSSYRGAYDFFYLPIDFKNKCNVGYAFINFMDYRRIVPFFREFNAQRWKNFNSEKVCAISYARIQGKASMISRFQNSSLMEKDGEYRPLIFHSAGPERGRPEPFPASSKAYRAVLAPAGGSSGVYGVRDRERSVSNSSTLSMS